MTLEAAKKEEKTLHTETGSLKELVVFIFKF